MQNIRNFSIIAHIDHGKSTLADRILQMTHAVNERDFQDQILDSLEIERQRGITIKSQAAHLEYKTKNGQKYELNLIDTPGHVDFSYEVSRSLAACEGVILLIDASQGVEAQTIANLYLAMENDLEIIPVLNKIDLPAANPKEITQQIENILGLPKEDILKISAKTGDGVKELIETIIEKIPPPSGDINQNLQALIFDSEYDSYQGTMVLARVFNGTVKPGDRIHFYHKDKEFTVEETGRMRLKRNPCDSLQAGEVGYIFAGIKSISDTKIGDTITHSRTPCEKPLKGYQEVKPMVFAGIYPTDANEYENLKKSLEKLKLNDASLYYETHASTALGFGFRCGFLGLLHMEIIQARLDNEFQASIVNTAPTVRYEVELVSGEKVNIDNPSRFPDPSNIMRAFEPYVKASIITPTVYLGNIMQLVMEKRGIQKDMHYLSETNVEVYYEIPLAEVIFDFYDKLKSATKGYASFDYDITDYREVNLVKVDILVNGDKVDALSMLTNRENARQKGKALIEQLKDLIPRHQFKIPLQAAIGRDIVARENIPAQRKNVTAKCYGGDVTRKRKLIEKQKEGKKKMKAVGDVNIPQEAFIAVLKT